MLPLGEHVFSLQLLGVAFFAYLLALAFYRLYLSPLAKFPGPKIAALSLWYEFYHEVVRRGQYSFEIQKMHKKYGPVVRINPYELHVSDPGFYEKLFAGPGKRRNKYPWSAAMFGNSTSMFSTVSHEQHRIRRAPLSPFFSKQSVQKLMPVILAKIERLCQRLEDHRRSGEPVRMDLAFSALTMDIITEYSFANSYEGLESPNFAPEWPEAMMQYSETSLLNKQFPWIVPILRVLPEWFVKKANPNMMGLLQFEKYLRAQVAPIVAGDRKPQKHELPTLFHELLESDLPPAEKTLERLADEGFTVVAAGTITTAGYLRAVLYHILANPTIEEKLRADIGSIMSDPYTLPPLRDLEALPYLTAVVQEGFRITHGVSARLTRIAPDEDLTLNQYVIPRGTPVGMNSIILHENEDVFPSPKTFDPARWLDPAEAKRLEKYLVTFSKGSRACLGIYLARAEIYLTLAALFGGRFRFQLFETTRRDIDIAHDFFNPSVWLESKGVRVVVK